MRRVFWVALGAGAGIYVAYRVNKAAQAYTPEGVGRSLASAGDGLRELSRTIREAMAEREQELRVALGVDTGAIDPQAARSLLENPSGSERDR